MSDDTTPGLTPGTWWACLRGPDQLPVLFETEEQAHFNADADEYIVPVHVTLAKETEDRPPATMDDVLAALEDISARLVCLDVVQSEHVRTTREEREGRIRAGEKRRERA